MAGIKDYSTTQANNTSLNGISTAEGMLPSNLNNAIRALMKNTREWFNDAQWVEYGDGDGAYTATYASATSFTISGVDVTAIYHANRRIKLTASTPGTIYGTISSSSFSTNTTVNVTWDSGSLSNESISNVYVAILSQTNDSIPEAVIDNAKIASSAAIDSTKIADGSISNAEFQRLNGVTSDIQTQLDAKMTGSNNLSDVSSASTARTNLGLGTIATQAANNVSISGGSVTGLGDPSATSDAATKNYVDQAVAGLRTRTIAEAATTANIDLTTDLQNGDTIDGVTLVTGDRVLVKNQTTATQNGLYIVVSSGTASRDPEHDTIAELSGGMVVVNQGTTNDNKIFLCTTDSDGTVGSTDITYTQVTPQNTGTVTSVAIADSGSSEFTVTNSPITSSGTINLAVNSIAGSKITDAVVNDTTPQLGGNLDTNSHNIDIDTAHGIRDENANEQITFTTTASAVNELTITNAATGNAPEIAASGSDTNIDLKLTPKGTGKLNLDGIKFPNADGTADQILKTDGSGNLSFADASGGGTSWQSVKTANFNAVAGEGYFVDTSSGAITATLPASPSIGDRFVFKDYAQTFATNALSLDPNGNKMEGLDDVTHTAQQDRMGLSMVFSDSTKGYVVEFSGNAQADSNTGGYNIAPPPYSVDFLVIAGGGSGSGSHGSGGGGAGGYRASYNNESSGGGGSSESAVTFKSGDTYTVTIGAGGTGEGAGSDSSISSTTDAEFTTLTSDGGGRGTGDGGSGGGGAGHGTQAAGTGTANQGRNGGAGSGGGGYRSGGGGGGAANAGNSGANGGAAGNGGNGVASTITGSSVTRAAGGGGGCQNGMGTSAGSGGTGGGGNGHRGNSPGNATVNTGSGAGGGDSSGGNGGSGVVILRMATSSYSGITTGSPTVTTDGSDTIITFTSSGSING